jgi:hypothetical protein
VRMLMTLPKRRNFLKTMTDEQRKTHRCTFRRIAVLYVANGYLLGFFVCVSARHSVCIFEINKFSRIPLGQLERLRHFARVLKRVKKSYKNFSKCFSPYVLQVWTRINV